MIKALTMSLEFKYKKYCYIDQFDMVNVTYMGNIVEAKNIKNVNTECRIQKLKNNKYKDKETGEVKECKKPIENRSQGDISLRRTRRDISKIITTNCSNENMKKCMFITLTYGEVMQDTKILNKDLKLFVRKFRYHYGKDIQFIMLPAPQVKRKDCWSWHIHCIFIFPKKAPFIDNRDIQDLWGHGITNSQYKLYDKIKNLAAYFIGHLRDMPLEEVIKAGIPYDEKDIKKVWINYQTGEKLDKPLLIVKGARTRYYPPNFKILRKSEKLDTPRKERKKYHELRKEVGYRIPTSSSTLQITDNENGWSNTIKTEEYNLSIGTTLKPNARDLKAINYIKQQQEKEMKNFTTDELNF